MLLAAAALPCTAVAATLPPNFSETSISGLSSPTALAIAPDGRVFVAQQGGALRVVKNGSLLATPFVSLTVDSAGERGLLGVAFDPSFATNRFVYVYHTVPAPPGGSPHNRVTRFTADAVNPDVAATGSGLPILDLENLGATNHNGGAIHFGPDGKLYVAVGENAVETNAQVLTNRLGKILRINADGTIPTNPFDAMTTGANKAIWAIGLRNPFTFAFQPGTGRMFVNDVGQSTWEEINDGIGGSNYGWPNVEGVAGNPSYRDPLFAYGHMSPPGVGPTGCAIVGAAFYNPTTPTFPADYAGDYFFADLCSGWIRRYDVGTSSASDFATGTSQPVDLAVASDGSLYYLQRGGSAQLYRVTYSAPTAVTVSSFTATRSARGVLLRWRAGDPRVLGFHVYRGGRRLDRAPIRSGSLLDRTAPAHGSLRYRLQAVLGDGSRVWVAATRFR